MKNLSIILAALLVLTTTACIKEYKCTCTDDNGESATNTIAPTTKNKAQESCDIYKSYLEDGSPGLTLNCELK